ncbi:MAG: hypothetical protein WDA68_01975 [Phycisphaerae bacterium]
MDRLNQSRREYSTVRQETAAAILSLSFTAKLRPTLNIQKNVGGTKMIKIAMILFTATALSAIPAVMQAAKHRGYNN